MRDEIKEAAKRYVTASNHLVNSELWLQANVWDYLRTSDDSWDFHKEVARLIEESRHAR